MAFEGKVHLQSFAHALYATSEISLIRAAFLVLVASGDFETPQSSQRSLKVH